MSAPQAPPDGPSLNGKLPRPDEDEIHAILQNIRAGEISVDHGRAFMFNFWLVRAAHLYVELVITDVLKYFRWAAVTWRAVFFHTLRTLFSKPPPDSEETTADRIGDWVSFVLIALAGTLILPLFLILCLIARFPPLARLYYFRSSLFRGGLELVNSGNPNLFKSLTIKQAQAAKIELGKSISESKDTDDTRHFNYDIAKILLQISAVMFEHGNDAIRTAAFGGTDSLGRGYEFADALGDDSIRRFCRQFGIEYQPVSELNNKSTAFCAVFWDPRSSWIIVGLKGTGPTEFGDWISDLDATMVPCDEYIKGFSLVHRGFKNQVFPDHGKAPSDREDKRPTNTISQSIQALVNHLQPNLQAGEKVNIWLTGMSLGSATASLVYARILMNPDDIGGDKAILRDAYLFGSPITCDAHSVKAFNDKMFEKGAPRRAMWRVTSAHDFVATGLPQFGDYLHIVDPKALHRPTTNYLYFAHLGTEVVLYDYPHSSSVRGNHLKHNVKVKIDSNHFTREDIDAFNLKRESKFSEKVRVKIGVAVQQIPLIGRFLAHSTVYYWDQLDRIALAECDWIVY